jgi:hypothetical protein
MAVRSSMADIIARVRIMINDTGGTPVFTDQVIQDTLDQRREDNRYMGLIPAETIAGPPSAGTVTWLDYSLEQWVALLKLEYDFDSEKDKYLRSQRVKMMTDMAATYRAKQLPQTATFTRDDTHPGSEVNWYLRPFSTR